MPAGKAFDAVRATVREHRLATVCEEAKCPNIGECWNAGTATLMLMGAVCTRACRFCAVDTGNPHGWLDAEEPANSARTVQLMRLKYVVLTSVNRDDLAGWRREPFRCVRARDQAAQSADRSRSADAGFPRRARRCRDGRRQRPGRVRAERRDGAALDSSGARSARRLRADAASARAREALPSRRADEDQPDARPGRDRRRDRRDDGRHPRRRRRHCSRSASICGRRRITWPSSAGSRRKSSIAIASGRSRKASSNASPGRWCARAIAPSARWNATTQACARADSRQLRDAMPTLHQPLTAQRSIRCSLARPRRVRADVARDAGVHRAARRRDAR